MAVWMQTNETRPPPTIHLHPTFPTTTHHLVQDGDGQGVQHNGPRDRHAALGPLQRDVEPGERGAEVDEEAHGVLPLVAEEEVLFRVFLVCVGGL